MYRENCEIEVSEGAKALMFLIFIGLLGTLFIGSCVGDEKIWNGGVHNDCGGHWVYEQAVGHRYSTNYIYKCDKCGYRYEFSEMR